MKPYRIITNERILTIYAVDKIHAEMKFSNHKHTGERIAKIRRFYAPKEHNSDNNNAMNRNVIKEKTRNA